MRILHVIDIEPVKLGFIVRTIPYNTKSYAAGNSRKCGLVFSPLLLISVGISNYIISTCICEPRSYSSLLRNFVIWDLCFLRYACVGFFSSFFPLVRKSLVYEGKKGKSLPTERKIRLIHLVDFVLSPVKSCFPNYANYNKLIYI